MKKYKAIDLDEKTFERLANIYKFAMDKGYWMFSCHDGETEEDEENRENEIYNLDMIFGYDVEE